MAQAILSEPVSSGNGLPGAMPILSLVNGHPRASSLAVAEHFKKRHDNVMRAITQTCHHLPSNFCALNFEETSSAVPGPKGGTRQERAYLMTRDGFTLIVMGFTGKEAMAWKLRYIEAFNAMEAELARKFPTAGTLTAAQQQEIKELVQAKASAYPDAVKRKVFSQIWMRLQRKFKVPRYEELPVALFGEARDYVIAMQIRSVAAPALEGAEPKSLPPARRRNNLDDYKAMFRELPDSPQHWLRLITETFTATEAFGKKLDAIKAEATKPFRSGRTSDVSSYFDASMSPMYDLFSIADEQLRLTYRCVYNALEGCRNAWLLLNKG